MKAVDPTIFVGVPGDVGDPITTEWTRAALATRLGQFVDFVDVHDYFTFTPLDSTSILGLTDQVSENIQSLRGVIGSAVPTRAPNIAVYFGEFGCTLSDGAHESAAVSGLFIAHVLGEVMAAGYDAASQWDVANGWPGFEPGPGDHGFLSAGSTVVPDFTPRPSYYAHYFFSRGFGDRLIRSLSSDAQVLVYASGYRTDTTVTVVLINQADSSRSVQLSPGRSGDHEFNSWVLAASSLDSMSVTLNGKGNGLPEGGPAIDQVIPYYSRVSNGHSLEFDLPPYSVTNVVIH